MTKNLHSAAPNKLFGLDHLRALAIIMVLFFHYMRFYSHPAWFPKVFDFGWTGVDLFFVLSGFLIASQLFTQIKKQGAFSIKEFYIKRFFRILPVYFVVVALYFVFPFFREKEALPPLWKFITFTQNLGANSTDFATFSHAWSLCVEEHFYLFFPLLLLFFKSSDFFHKSYLILLLFFFAGFVIRYYCWYNIYLPGKTEQNSLRFWVDTIYYPTYNRLDGLLAGVAIAALYNFMPAAFNKISKYGNLLIAAGIGILVVVYFFLAEFETFSTSIFGFPLIAIGYGIMITGAVSHSCFLFKWQSKFTSFIAALSYALYLSHKSVIHMVQEIFSNWGIEKESNLMLFICLLLSITAAWIINITIEKPFMKMRDKFLNPIDRNALQKVVVNKFN